MKSYVYVIVLKDQSKFKIGKADNIYGRIKTLQKEWGEFDLEKSFALECNEREVFKIEKNLHFLFKKYNLNLPSKHDGSTEFFTMDCFHLIENAIQLLIGLKDIKEIELSEKDFNKVLFSDKKTTSRKLPYNSFLKYCFEEMKYNPIPFSSNLDSMYIEFEFSYLIPKLNIDKKDLNNYIENILEKSKLELNANTFQIFNKIEINDKKEILRLYYSKSYHFTILSFLAYDNFNGNYSFLDLYNSLYKGKYLFLDQAFKDKYELKSDLNYFYKFINQKILKEDLDFATIFIERIDINPFQQNYIELSEFEFNRMESKLITFNFSNSNYRLYSEVKRESNKVKIYFNPLDHCFIFLSFFENQFENKIRELLLNKYISLIKGFNEKSYLDLFKEKG